MIYRHPKYTHTQDVGEWETTKRKLLERAGWKADKLAQPETPPAEAAPAEDKAPKPTPTRRRTRRKKATTE